MPPPALVNEFQPTHAMPVRPMETSLTIKAIRHRPAPAIARLGSTPRSGGGEKSLPGLAKFPDVASTARVQPSDEYPRLIGQTGFAADNGIMQGYRRRIRIMNLAEDILKGGERLQQGLAILGRPEGG